MRKRPDVAKMTDAEWREHLNQTIFVRGISYEDWLRLQRAMERSATEVPSPLEP